MQISASKVGSFLAGGAAAQVAGAVAGLLLVRWMSVSDYAIYTIGITIVGTIRLLTRGGVQMGLAAELARIWPDQQGAAAALGAAFRVRWLISIITMPVILLTSWLLLDRAGASAATLSAILAILVITWLAEMYGSVIDQVLFFDGKSVRLQTLDLAISVGRLILICALRVMSAVSATTALLSNVFTIAARIPHIRKWVGATLGGAGVKSTSEAAKTVRTIALRQIPVDIFVALQAQTAIFYLTRGGGGYDLATYGALARIGQILAPFSGVILAFFVPAFAKVRDGVVRRILGFVAIGALPGLALLGWAIAAPGTLLFLIGPDYAGQEWPLIVCAATIAIMTAVDIAASLVAHRGWNRWGWVRIAFGIVWIFVAPGIVAVDTVVGAYLFFCGFSIGTVVAMGLELLSVRSAGEIRFS